MRRNAVELIDQYLDVEWLAWTGPIGTMTATETKAKKEEEMAARRKAAAEEQRKAARERRKAEEDRAKEEELRGALGNQQTKREVAAKAERSLRRTGRRAVSRKASRASGLGEDHAMSGSEGTGAEGLPHIKTKKSEKTPVGVDAAWLMVKRGQVPAGYVRVSRS
jgi:hypothetical protein